MKRATLLLLCSVLAACTAQPPCVEETVVLLPVASRDSDLERARTVFDGWLLANRRMPNANFRLLQIGSVRSTQRELLAVTIPPSWKGPNAVANRDAFVTQARELFDRTLTDRRKRLFGTQSSLTLAVQTTIVTLPACDSRDVPWRWTSHGKATNAAVLCDRSASGSGSACTSAAVLRAMDAWLPKGFATGSSFRVWIVGRSIADATRVFSVETPELPIADRAAYLLGARNELSAALEQDTPRAGSDIAGALAAAVAELSRRGSAKELYILSDLRLNAGPYSFDRRVPPPDEFLEWLAAEQLLPDCSDVALTACGMHFRTTPGTAPFDASRDARVRAAWMEAFKAMHAASIEIRGACDTERFISQKGGV